MKAALLAVLKPKGKGAPPVPAGDEEEAPESSSEGGDYKQIMKDAANDGDWDAFVDALCSYVGK